MFKKSYKIKQWIFFLYFACKIKKIGTHQYCRPNVIVEYGGIQNNVLYEEQHHTFYTTICFHFIYLYFGTQHSFLLLFSPVYGGIHMIKCVWSWWVCSKAPTALSRTRAFIVRVDHWMRNPQERGSGRFSCEGTNRNTRPWPTLLTHWRLIPRPSWAKVLCTVRLIPSTTRAAHCFI
jgi:hypothetical protein